MINITLRFILIVFAFLMPLTSVFATNIIRTSSVHRWTQSSLKQLIEDCEEESVIIFDADYDYFVDECIRPKVSIAIDGCGKILRTINKTNYVISLLDVEEVNSFKIEDLIIDGGSTTTKTGGVIPKEFFITVKNVNEVSFTHCTFQNIRTDYPNWHKGEQPYTIWVENYMTFSFCDNIVTNIDCPEFLIASLPKNNKDKKRIVNISRNKMQFVRTSTAIEVRFGRFKINNNEIGVTHGSSVNAFGFDSEIVENVFRGSHNSSSIDLSEQFAFKYSSSNILVKDNYSEYSHDGFLMADNVRNISILNNTYRADIYSEDEHVRYDRLWSTINRECDLALRLEHELSNIRIINNSFVGSNALVFLWTLGRKKNVRIENNKIISAPHTNRSTLFITQSDGLYIKNNTFVNTGSSLSYLEAPQFIVIGPTKSSSPKERFIKNMHVIGNTFSFSMPYVESAYILAHTIYDKENCNTLSTLRNIELIKNESTFRGDIILVTDDFKTPRAASVTISGNSFRSGILKGNVFNTTTMGGIRRLKPLVANTVVEKNGKKYYVIIGGVTSFYDVNYNDNDFIHDGNAILRRIFN